MTTRRQFAALLAACMLCPNLARADDWPSRPVTIVVPFAPGGATDIVKRLSLAVQEAYKKPQVQTTFSDRGVEAIASTPEQLSALIRRDTELWGQVVKAGNVTLN